VGNGLGVIFYLRYFLGEACGKNLFCGIIEVEREGNFMEKPGWWDWYGYPAPVKENDTNEK
jgi:hypothetical protein